MSEYMKLKAQMDELLAQARAIESKIAPMRKAELEAEVTDIRKRIVAFGIPKEMLYPELKRKAPSKRKHYKPSTKPAKYAWNGHQWHGAGGAQPKWVKAALAQGITLDQMLISNQPKQ